MEIILTKIGRSYLNYWQPYATYIDTDDACKRLLVTLSSNAVVEISVGKNKN